MLSICGSHSGNRSKPLKQLGFLSRQAGMVSAPNRRDDALEALGSAIDARDPAGKAVLEGEGCNAFVPGVTTGWGTLEIAAEQARVL